MVTKAPEIEKKRKRLTKGINLDKVILLTVELNETKEALKALKQKNKTMYSPGDEHKKTAFKKKIKSQSKALRKRYA